MNGGKAKHELVINNKYDYYVLLWAPCHQKELVSVKDSWVNEYIFK